MREQRLLRKDRQCDGMALICQVKGKMSMIIVIILKTDGGGEREGERGRWIRRMRDILIIKEIKWISSRSSKICPAMHHAPIKKSAHWNQRFYARLTFSYSSCHKFAIRRATLYARSIMSYRVCISHALPKTCKTPSTSEWKIYECKFINKFGTKYKYSLLILFIFQEHYPVRGMWAELHPDRADRSRIVKEYAIASLSRDSYITTYVRRGTLSRCAKSQ